MKEKNESGAHKKLTKQVALWSYLASQSNKLNFSPIIKLLALTFGKLQARTSKQPLELLLSISSIILNIFHIISFFAHKATKHSCFAYFKTLIPTILGKAEVGMVYFLYLLIGYCIFPPYRSFQQWKYCCFSRFFTFSCSYLFQVF